MAGSAQSSSPRPGSTDKHTNSHNRWTNERGPLTTQCRGDAMYPILGAKEPQSVGRSCYYDSLEPEPTEAKRGGCFIGKWHAAKCCSPNACISGTSSAQTSWA